MGKVGRKKGRREHGSICLAHDEEIATMGNTLIKNKGEKAPAKRRCLPDKTTAA
jgi:hypothetical protein